MSIISIEQQLKLVKQGIQSVREKLKQMMIKQNVSQNSQPTPPSPSPPQQPRPQFKNMLLGIPATKGSYKTSTVPSFKTSKQLQEEFYKGRQDRGDIRILPQRYSYPPYRVIPKGKGTGINIPKDIHWREKWVKPEVLNI